GQVENMSVEGLFVHGGDLWRLNTPLSCLQPPQQGKTHAYTVSSPGEKINRNLPFCCREFNRFSWFLICQKKPLHYPILNAR
ncbi:hypothetical protein ACWJQR_23930, partial [Klebsiella pneumoniae]